MHHQCSLLSDPKDEIALAGAQTCPAWILPNDGEAGYYQVAYEGDLLKKVLADRGSHLSAAERVGVLGDVDSLAGEGEVSAQVALELVPEFSKDPDWHVVQAAANIAALLQGRERSSQPARERRSIHSTGIRRKSHSTGVGSEAGRQRRHAFAAPKAGSVRGRATAKKKY